jgi:hypothetical protein
MAEKNLDILEQKILLALRYSLQEGIISETALQDMLKAVEHGEKETAHTSQFRWEGAGDAFKLKVVGTPYEDAVTSSFFQTHNYKYLDDPTFKLSFERELRGRALPEKEISSAMTHLDSLISDLSKNPSEQDAGWNPNMADLRDVTSNADSRTPKSTEPFSGGGLYPEGDKYDKGTLEGF